jgi:hypothetical protein
MRRMDPRQISDTFNAKRRQSQEEWERAGLLKATEDFSAAMSELKSAGMDVSVEIFADAAELGFALFDAHSIRTPVTGILHIGPIHRLFAFCIREKDQPALKLAVSEFDIRFHGTEGKMDLKEGDFNSKVRADIFDLKNDPDALIKLQEEVIRMNARNAVIFDHDKANFFDKPDRLQKPVLRKPPNTP